MVTFGVQQHHIGMHDPDEESNMLVRNVGSYLLVDKAEDQNVRQHGCENFRSRKTIFTFASKQIKFLLIRSFRNLVRY